MLEGYHRIFNNFGLQQVNRGIDVPDPALGIGFAENTASLPVKMVLSPKQKNPKMQTIKTLDQSSIDGQGSPVSMSMFPNSGYMGEQLGGF